MKHGNIELIPAAVENPSKAILGDCICEMMHMEDKQFSLIVTDPPYGVDLEYNTYEDSEENWYKLMDLFIPIARRVATMVIMPSCRIKALPWIYQNHPPDWIISWYKGSPGHVSAIGFNDWEPLLVYGRTKGCQMHDHFTMTNDVPMGSFGHPCPKPVKWFSWLMHRAIGSSPKNVLDPFMGSQSSRIAAHELGFKYTGIELDKDYYEAACKRFRNHVAQQKLFV